MHFLINRIKVLEKLFFNVWSGSKRVLMHFQNTRIKSSKIIFFTSGVVKNVFDAFPDHQNQVLKKKIFNVWSGFKRVFMHLRILPDHQNQVIEKLFFSPLK
jgi:hypothetical protein